MQMTTQTRTNTPDEPHELAAVLEEVPATARGDGGTGTGPIAIFYGAAHYPFELARQRELVEDYADAARPQPGHRVPRPTAAPGWAGHSCSMPGQRGGVEYVITAGWPTPQLHRS